MNRFAADHWLKSPADRDLIVLQPMGIAELPAPARPKARVIYQSVERTPAPVTKSPRWFDVCVLGHLRPVKDPFRTARAARLLPPTSRIRVLHVGGALSDDMEECARAEAAENPPVRERETRAALLGELRQG